MYRVSVLQTRTILCCTSLVQLTSAPLRISLRTSSTSSSFSSIAPRMAQCNSIDADSLGYDAKKRQVLVGMISNRTILFDTEDCNAIPMSLIHYRSRGVLLLDLKLSCLFQRTKTCGNAHEFKEVIK